MRAYSCVQYQFHNILCVLLLSKSRIVTAIGVCIFSKGVSQVPGLRTWPRVRDRLPLPSGCLRALFARSHASLDTFASPAIGERQSQHSH